MAGVSWASARTGTASPCANECRRDMAERADQGHRVRRRWNAVPSEPGAARDVRPARVRAPHQSGSGLADHPGAEGVSGRAGTLAALAGGRRCRHGSVRAGLRAGKCRPRIDGRLRGGMDGAEAADVLRRFGQPGTLGLLQACRAHGVRLAALSDYPAEGKLTALGLDGPVRCRPLRAATWRQCVQAEPKGLLRAMESLGTAASETLYVGDRLDVDLPTAQAAGVRCVIIARGGRRGESAGCTLVASYSELQRLLWPSAVPNG